VAHSVDLLNSEEKNNDERCPGKAHKTVQYGTGVVRAPRQVVSGIASSS